MILRYLEYITENDNYEDMFIEYNDDKYVYHITGEVAANNIRTQGFKTGNELGVAEKRGAIYFSDYDVNYGIYARNQDGEVYDGENIGEVKVNIKGLKLLNLSYKTEDGWINHKKYNTFAVRGELDKIPYDIDGTISFLENGKIFEVALKKEVANKVIIKV